MVKKFYGITSFAASHEPPQGRFAIISDGLPIDFYYDHVGSRTTLIAFHGAVSKDLIPPVFVGRSIARSVGVNILSVSDPSILISDEITLSWFAGNYRQVHLQSLIQRVISTLVRTTVARRLIFLGGSGGGFAALDMSRRFPSSLAIVMNPQTSLGAHRPNALGRYMRNAWPEIKAIDELPESCVHDQIKAYSEGFNNTVAYIQHYRDLKHIKNHMVPFMKAVGDSPNVWLYTDDWGPKKGNPHRPLPRETLQAFIRRLIKTHGAWPTALKQIGFTQSPTDVIDRWNLRNVVQWQNEIVRWE